MAKIKLTNENIPEVASKWANGEISLKDIVAHSDEQLFSVAHNAYFLLMQGKVEEARILFEGLVAIDPRNDYYYRALGIIFDKLGNPERAIRQFSYAIRVNPNSPYAYVNRAEVYVALGQFQEAEKDLRAALERMDYKDQVISRKAWALLRVASSKILQPSAT